MIDYTHFSDYKFLVSISYPLTYLNINQMLISFLKDYQVLFDGDPIVIPIPEGMPHDFPRMILKSKDELWQLDVSYIRLTLNRKIDLSLEKDIDLADFLNKAQEIFETIRAIYNMSFGRIGVIVEKINTIDLDKTGYATASHFCKDEWINTVLNRPERFELHAYKRFKLSEDFPVVNSWIRHKTESISLDATTEKTCLVVQRDLNTLQELLEKENFDKERLYKFFQIIPDEMESLLKKYYPKGDRQ